MRLRLQLKYENSSVDPGAFTSTKAFRKIFKPLKSKKYSQPRSYTHLLSINLPRMQQHKKLCITGNAEEMGAFDPVKPVFFREKKNGKAFRKLDLSDEAFPIEYKLAVFDTEKKRIVDYEPGDNRILENGDGEISVEVPPQFIVKHLWKGAGINIPLFSLRSGNSWGIGDLSDLKLFVRFASKAGMKLLQLLPLNDTCATGTDKDSYPYSAISAFAVDPKYLDVEKILDHFNEILSEDDRAEIRKLNALSVVNHVSVRGLKLRVLRSLFEKNKGIFFSDKGWPEFFTKNKEWLEPYAAFCVLRDRYGTADHSLWKEHSAFDAAKFGSLAEEMSFWFFVQYLLHGQLTAAVKFARKKGVMLKADLPIGVGTHSADTWQYPELFSLHMQAGAPPDAFAESGQNWGFPTYNISAMKADNYNWFKRRMANLENYFDAIRIDHVLGFFRIWSIPLGGSGLTGRFVPMAALQENDFVEAGISFDEKRFTQPFGDDPADVILLRSDDGFHFRINMQKTLSFAQLNDAERKKLNELYHQYFFRRSYTLWKTEGEEKLNMLKQFTSMMLCAEDLGMVPEFLEEVLHELNILSLQVQQMPKKNNERFSDTTAASYDSVVMPDTHDMAPVRLWWEQNRRDAQIFFNEVLKEEGEAPYFCEPWICKRIVEMHLQSPAAWSIFLLQDLLAMNGHIRRPDPSEERINDPANAEHVWNYRMHLTVEDLLEENDFIKTIKKIVRESGR